MSMHDQGSLVARFARALNVALYDVQIERTRPLHIFYDADSIIPMVQGARQFEDGPTSTTTHRHPLLARSLLSLGLLGKAHVLRPHALELDGQVRVLLASDSNQEDAEFGHAIRRFLEAENAIEQVRELHTALTGTSTETGRVDAMVEALKRVGSRTFVALELAGGPWQQRLRRLWGGVLKFERPTGDLGQLMTSDAFRAFNGALVDRRPQTPVSNVHDAAALALLHESILTSIDPPSSDLPRAAAAPCVRFYTETPSIHDALDAPELRELISYPGSLAGTKGWDLDRLSILRNADYLIVRATFGALAMDGGVGAHDRGEVGEDDLRDVAKQLEMLLETSSELSRAELRNLKVGTRALGAILEDFDDLSFVGRVLPRLTSEMGGLPKAFGDSVEALMDVWRFLDSKAELLQEHVRLEVGHIQKELAESLSLWRAWSDSFRKIKGEAGALRTRLGGEAPPDVDRDLGLARWGLRLTLEERERLDAFISGCLGEHERERSTVASRLASTCADCRSESQCVVSAAMLWLLGSFPRVVNVIEAYRNQTARPLRASLALMRHAALARINPARSQEETDAVLSELEAIAHDLPDREKGAFYIGIGFVAYHSRWFAYLEKPGQAACNWPSEYARRTIGYGEQAAALLTPGSLEWGFAINHCVWVSAVAGSELVQSRHVDALMSLRPFPEVWHYRFADTLAHERYLRAKARWTGRAGDDSSRRDEACELLTSAREWLRVATPDFGDVEVDGHRRDVERLANEMRCHSPSRRAYWG